jgi:non-ribosomal peptide synthetase component F
LPPADPDRLAYVMFTSGSTGLPKAVAVRHRDVAALATDSRFAGGVCDRVLLHSPAAFDAATFEVWAPLLNGGRVVVAPGESVDAALLRRLAADGGLTALWLTAGLFRLLAQDAPDCFRGLTQVWTGGDVVPAPAVRRVLAACPGLTVVDGYGPTETTTFATSFALTDPAAVPDTVPIGRPLDDMRAHLLDARLRPVPPGCPGELYLAEGVGEEAGWPERASPAAIWAAPARVPPASSPTPSARPAPACTAQATWPGGARTAPWSSWAGPTTRSRSAASGSSPARPRQRSPPTRA